MVAMTTHLLAGEQKPTQADRMNPIPGAVSQRRKLTNLFNEKGKGRTRGWMSEKMPRSLPGGSVFS